jgi:hypothetical protein
MFRKPNTTLTASITPTNRVVVECSDGFEDIIDHHADFGSYAEANTYLVAKGFETYDPNAELKAAGFVFINGCYRRVGA